MKEVTIILRPEGKAGVILVKSRQVAHQEGEECVGSRGEMSMACLSN